MPTTAALPPPSCATGSSSLPSRTRIFAARNTVPSSPPGASSFASKQAGFSAYDLDHVAISRDSKAHLAQKVLFALRKRPLFGVVRDRVLNMAPFATSSPRYVGLSSSIKLGSRRSSTASSITVHMASAFFVYRHFERLGFLDGREGLVLHFL